MLYPPNPYKGIAIDDAGQVCEELLADRRGRGRGSPSVTFRYCPLPSVTFRNLLYAYRRRPEFLTRS